MHWAHPGIAARWDKEFPNQKNLPERKKKYKLRVNNKMRGALASVNIGRNGKVESKDGIPKIEVNVKAHKGDRAELASTIKHELMHVKYPKMTEKQVYKRTAKTKILPEEQHKLLAKLKRKKLNYKLGAQKRKYKLGRSERPAGTFIRLVMGEK